MGNLGDISYRAIEVLRSVAAILAEDTRRTRQLLDHYGVSTPMVAYHEHNEARSVPGILERLSAGEDLALVSDAGTPLLSDPGGRLVRAAVERGVEVVPVPGASALLAALVAAGFDTEHFTYLGFLPRRGGDRAAAIAAAVGATHAVALYEAPQRVAATLQELAGAGAAGRPAVVARELTKKFEEFRRGTVAELAAYYEDSPARGEVVILLGPAAAPTVNEDDLLKAASSLHSSGISSRDVVRRLVEDYGAPRNVAYRLAQQVGK